MSISLATKGIISEGAGFIYVPVEIEKLSLTLIEKSSIFGYTIEKDSLTGVLNE